MMESFDDFQPKSLDKTLKYETKILGVSPESLKEKLYKSGFNKRFEHHIQTQWLKSNDHCIELRVRTEDKITTITRKVWNKDGSSDGQPLSSEILGEKNFKKTVAELIDKGWVKAGSESIKRRVRYIMDLSILAAGMEVHLDFDTYTRLKGEAIPEFLRIKTVTANEIPFLVKILGFPENTGVNYGPKNLLNHYHPEKSKSNKNHHQLFSTDNPPLLDNEDYIQAQYDRQRGFEEQDSSLDLDVLLLTE